MDKHKKLDQSERLMIEVELNLKYPLQTISLLIPPGTCYVIHLLGTSADNIITIRMNSL